MDLSKSYEYFQPEKQKDRIHIIAVSYTHLDVYKRQECGECHAAELTWSFMLHFYGDIAQLGERWLCKP